MTNERTLRHPNGGALKIGLEVHVSADSFCDCATEIGGRSAIVESDLINSIIVGSQVFESDVTNVWLNSSVCSKSGLQGVFAEDCILDRVKIDSGHLLRLQDVVAENCEMYGNWTLEGNARIPTGVWHRSPRFLRITGGGVDFGLTESTEGHAMLGCFRKPLTELLHAGPRLGRKRGWSEEQIKAAKEFYEQLGDVPLDGVQP